MTRTLSFLIALGLLTTSAQARPKRSHRRASSRIRKARPTKPASFSLPGVKAAEPAATRRPGVGQVRSATSDRAFLDRGTREGLSPGTSVQLLRRGRPLGTCVADHVSDHWASCPVAIARSGDGFRYRPTPPPPPAEVAALPVPQGPDAIARAKRILSEQPFTQVRSEASASGAHPKLRASASLQHETWMMVGRSETGFDAESLHLRFDGTPLAGGFRLYVDATAYQWTRRPTGFRSPDTHDTQLYVNDLEVAQRELGRSWALAAGRVWAYRAAGLGVFDGAQVGWRSRDGEWEAGALGGVLPDPVTLAPSTSTPLIGAYAAWTHRDKTSLLRWIDVEAHAVSYLPSGGDSVLRLETLARAWLPAANVGADVQVAPVGSEHVLEAARLDLSANPLEVLHLVLTGRYDALPDDVLTLPGETGAGHRSRRGDLLATWDVMRDLSVGVNGGQVRDLDTGVWHGYLGPQLALPRLFGSGGLALAYLEERGTSAGRSAWIQATGSPGASLYLLGRASWYESSADTVSGTELFDELGLYAHLDWRFHRAFWLRLSTLARLDLTATTEDTGLTLPLGLDARLALGGEF